MADDPTPPEWGYGLDAGNLAADIMRMVQTFADNATLQAQEIAEIFREMWTVGTIDEVFIPAMRTNEIDFNRARQALNEVLANFPEDPDLNEIDLTIPEPDEFKPLPPMPPVDINDFVTPAPDINIGDPPEFGVFTKPEPDEIVYPPRPEKPPYTIPPVPNLSDIIIPDPLGMEIPVFDEELVDDELTAPTNTFSYDEVAYESTLLDAVKSGLLDEILNGGYGLNPNDEQDIWNRGRERELQASQLAVDDATRMFSLSGMPMPTGAMNKAVSRIKQEALNKISSFNREVSIKTADLYWEGKKFSYEKAIEVEKILIDLHNAVYERALNAAKAEVQVGIDIFNAQVALANARNQRFIALAEVYKTQIDAEIAKVELYKAMLEGAKIKQEINEGYISLYNSQLQGVKLIIDIYSADVQAYGIMAEVEKLKVEIFRAEVEAYIGEVQAKKAEFEAYEASVNGEVAKVNAYRAEAEAYKAYVDGKKAYIEAKKIELDAVIEENRFIIDEYKVTADVYSDRRQAQLQVNQGEIDAYKGKVTAFDAEMGAVVESWKLSTNAEDLEYRAQTQAIQANTDNARLQLEKVIETARLQIEALRAEADIHRSLAASSMASINANASLGGSQSENWSESISQSRSASTMASSSDSVSRQISASASTSSSVSSGVAASISAQVSSANTAQAISSTESSRSSSSTANDNHSHTYEEKKF